MGADELAQSGFEAVQIESPFAEPTKSLWHPPGSAKHPVIIHFHGNAGSAYQRIPIYQQMAKDGAGVLGVGYPGYGGNSGKPTEQSFHQTAQANYNWLLDKGYSPQNIVIVGQSIGSGSATRLASNNEAAGLILEAPFTSTADIAARQFPYLPVGLLMKDTYPNINYIDDINMPLAWIHGTLDEVIDYEFGQTLFNAAQEPKRTHPMKGGGHNDLWMRGIDQIIRDEAAVMVRDYKPRKKQGAVSR